MSKAAEGTPRIRIVVADDHSVMRSGLVALIAGVPDMVVVAQAGDGRMAVEAHIQYHPDVTLIDLQMPVMDGVEAITRVCRVDPTARFVILTAFAGDEDVYRGVRAGARAYLQKGCTAEQLLDCIRAVHLGQTRIPPDLVAKVAERMRGPALSPRELEVLRLLADGCGNKEIAAALSISDSTVKAHVNNILGKLNVTTRTEAVTSATRRGFLRNAR